MARRPTKQALSSRYADQRREAKAQYVAEKGSGRGWRSSSDYKRIARNERRAYSRYYERRQERDLEKYERRESVKQVQEWSIFHTSLGYNDKISREIRDQFKTLAGGGRENQMYLTINEMDANGNTVVKKILRTQKEADEALQALYKQLQQAQAGAGKDEDGNQRYPMVSATSSIGPNADFFVVNYFIPGDDDDELPEI